MISATSDSTAVTMSAVATWSLDDHREQPVARLGERGEGLERFEGHRQAPAVTLVLVARAGAWRGCRLRGAALGAGALLGGCRSPDAGRCWPCVAVALGLGRCCLQSAARASSLGSPAILADGCRAVLSAAAGRTVERTSFGSARRKRARRSARSVSSRPSSATLSKMPGRDGRAGDRHAQRLVDLARLDAEALDDRLQRLPHVRLVEARRARRAPRAPRASAARPSSPSQRSRASGRRRARRSSEPASGQKSASVWIFSWLIATARAKRAILGGVRVAAARRGTARCAPSAPRRAARGCRRRSASAA